MKFAPWGMTDAEAEDARRVRTSILALARHAGVELRKLETRVDGLAGLAGPVRRELELGLEELARRSTSANHGLEVRLEALGEQFDRVLEVSDRAMTHLERLTAQVEALESPFPTDTTR